MAINYKITHQRIIHYESLISSFTSLLIKLQNPLKENSLKYKLLIFFMFINTHILQFIINNT
jgi:hypothetical protein